MKRTLATIAALATLSGAAMAETTIKFANDWKWEGPSAPLLLALDKGYYTAEGLSVTLDTGAGSLDAIPKVATGT